MTGNKFVFLLCFAVFTVFQQGDALKCNLCVGSLTSDCANNVTSSFVDQTCLRTAVHTHNYLDQDELDEFIKETDEDSEDSASPEDHPKFDTFCIYLTTKDGRGAGLVERGCAYIHRRIDICKFIKKKFKSVKTCKACRKDNCN